MAAHGIECKILKVGQESRVGSVHFESEVFSYTLEIDKTLMCSSWIINNGVPTLILKMQDYLPIDQKSCFNKILDMDNSFDGASPPTNSFDNNILGEAKWSPVPTANLGSPSQAHQAATGRFGPHNSWILISKPSWVESFDFSHFGVCFKFKILTT